VPREVMAKLACVPADQHVRVMVGRPSLAMVARPNMRGIITFDLARYGSSVLRPAPLVTGSRLSQ
jgi:hypothetical protein